jgi:hypothetical protein
MKNILLIGLLITGTLSFGQNKDCKIDYEEKTDSTYVKKTIELLVHERVFGTSQEMIFFSLFSSNGVPTLEIQQIEKSKEFIRALCFDENSKLIFQLDNGKFISLLNTGQENCSNTMFDEETKSNIKVISNYFVFLKENYEELKKSPISILRIKYVGETKDIIFKKELTSEMIGQKTFPSNYFMDYLHCVE